MISVGDGSALDPRPRGPGAMSGPADAGLTRRRLLALGALAATAVAWPPALDYLTPPAPASMPVAELLRRSRFSPHVGELFRLSAPGGQSIDVRLDEIQDLSRVPGAASAGAEDGFVLLFGGPSTPRLGQDVLRVSHPRLGTVELLVSPASTGAGGQDYAAVINRLTPPQPTRSADVRAVSR